MKELTTDPKLKELFKPLPEKELSELKDKLLTKYDGTPLYIWKNNIIVDGHNRYPILKEYNIDFNIENVEDFLGNNCTRSDVMQWMMSHQEARRNLELGEKIYANSLIAEEIEIENKEKVSKAVSESNKNRNSNSVQMDRTEKYETSKSHTLPTHTREQIAKMSGVGTGTVARYDAVMNSDDEELKEKVKTGQVKIGTAYREIKEKEQPKKENIINSLKDLTDEYVGSQNSGHFGEYFNEDKTTDKIFTNEDVVNAYKDTKTLKNAIDMLDIKDEFETFKDDVNEKLETYSNRLFSVYRVNERITEEEKDFAIDLMCELIEDIKKIITQIKGE